MRLLIVEDEPATANLLKRVLERAGHNVTTALTAEDALDQDATFDLVVADIQLPGVDGDAMVRRMRERHPALKAILTSGYPHEPREGVLFLQKPFLPKTLVEMIERMFA